MDDDGWYERLIETVRAAASGCCGDESWRGRFCQYHQGYIDGADAEHESRVA